MPTVLITGASRGIGLEFARQYAADGWQVVATCRSPDAADALRGLAGDVTIPKLDVDRPDDVAALRTSLAGRPIDVLVNNAGVIGPRGLGFGQFDYDAWAAVMATNALAPIRLAEALVDHVAASGQRRMAFVTSMMGSIAMSGGGSHVYRTSKAALNMAVSCIAHDLRGRGVACVLFHPGHVRTDMGGAGAPVLPRDSVAGMRRLIERLDLAGTGRFLDYQGKELPW